MKLLLIAATAAEIAPSTAFMEENGERVSGHTYRIGAHEVTVAISGVGMMQAAYHITKALTENAYDIAIQAGIGGSFDRNILLGEVVNVVSEQYGDLGAEDHDAYIDIFDLGFLKADEHPFEGQLLRAQDALLPDAGELRKVKSLTVNTVSGNEKTIARLMQRYGCDVESMEGAAFHYVCLVEKVPFIQIRAISNYIEPRNRSKWQIGAAVKNLNQWLIKALQR